MKYILFVFILLYKIAFCFSQYETKLNYIGFTGNLSIMSHNYYGGDLGVSYLHKVCMDNKSGYPVMLIWTSLEGGFYNNWSSANRIERLNFSARFNLNAKIGINPSIGISLGGSIFENSFYFVPAPDIGICYNSVERRKPFSINLFYRFNPLLGQRAIILNEIGIKTYFSCW